MIPGVRLRLALALLVVVAAALAVAYAIVVPTLQGRLVDAKLAQLEQDTATVAACVESTGFAEWQLCADEGASVLHSRVLVYQRFDPDPQSILRVIADSQNSFSRDVERDAVARRAAATGRPATGTVTRRGERFAEAARPAADGAVVLVTSSLADPLSSVAVVQRRLLVAGLLALVVAGLVGYGGASLHARRIRRLERAAERIASGRFDEPVVDEGNDELGELATAFEHMRLRLENLDRARREFIANASHELRTPLFSLGGFLELLLDEELDLATRREFLTTMSEQVERLTKLATDLLDLSRLDAGRMRVEREPVDLAEVARLLCAEFRAVAEQRQHVLTVEHDGEAVAVADEQRVLQIGRTLVENALVHTPRGTTVVVRSARDADGVELSVTDDGPGISPADAPHVFERFYRADGDRASGSGLGLAIARELALLMGGGVELVSEPGRTQVTLELAARPAEQRVSPREPVFT